MLRMYANYEESGSLIEGTSFYPRVTHSMWLHPELVYDHVPV